MSAPIPVPDDLAAAARAARKSAYAPYSKFRVGAALRAASGAVFSGCNVENAAYPEGVCAEAGAISAMVLAGHTRLREVVVVGNGQMPCTPCGGCRQKLREFGGPDTVIHLIGEDGTPLGSHRLDALLPHSFGPDNLEEDTKP